MKNKLARKIILENLMDRLLDKISSHGIDSLTPSEKELMDNLSKSDDMYNYQSPEDNAIHFLESNFFDIEIEDNYSLTKENELHLVVEVFVEDELIAQLHVGTEYQRIGHLVVNKDFFNKIMRKSKVKFKDFARGFQKWLSEKIGHEIRLIQFF